MPFLRETQIYTKKVREYYYPHRNLNRETLSQILDDNSDIFDINDDVDLGDCNDPLIEPLKRALEKGVFPFIFCYSDGSVFYFNWRELKSWQTESIRYEITD